MKNTLSLAIVPLVLTLISASATPTKVPGQLSNLLHEKQIETYVQNIIASLLHGSAARDQQAICKHITKKISTPTGWEKSYNLPVERTQQEVYQAVLSGILDFVERQSFTLAKKETGDYLSTTQISEKIRNELAYKISSTDNFIPGELSEFIGKNLEYKVQSTCYYMSIPYKPFIKRYDEKKCRICFNRFNSSRPWIYISPCGHDICTTCADTYFIRQDKVRCPACNQFVDTYQIRMNLYIPTVL